jgi:uncharacterized phage-associated protein
LQLQKLVYFCHVWSLIEFGVPLVKHSFEAWENGPILPYLYRDFRQHGSAPITGRALALDAASGVRRPAYAEFDGATRAMLEQVLNFYARLRASMLAALTHAEHGPWHKVWHHKGSIEPGMKIDDREIVRFYSRLWAPVTQ